MTAREFIASLAGKSNVDSLALTLDAMRTIAAEVDAGRQPDPEMIVAVWLTLNELAVLLQPAALAAAGRASTQELAARVKFARFDKPGAS